MRIALLDRNKLVMVNGAGEKSIFHNKYEFQWEQCNAIVLSWLTNFVTPSLVSSIAYASSAKRYGKILKKDSIR